MANPRNFSLNTGWRALLSDLDLRPERVLRRAGLPEDLFVRTDKSLSTPEYFRFWQALEAEAGDPMFALRIVDAVSAESFDPPIFAALCSANLMQAVQRLARYKPLVAPMALQVDVTTNGDLTLSPRWTLARSEIPQSLQVAEIAFFVRLARLGTREPVRAKHVVLPAPRSPSDAKRYRDWFGGQVAQGAQPGITFAAADALRPFLTLNEGMWSVFEPDLRRRLSELDATATTTDRVKALLLELLPGGAATVDTVAHRLAMSRRTLQRRLDDEGENFRALVGDTREQLARHYLTNTAMPGAEIAFLLGFEDPNSFYRAFQDWTGQTSESARHAMRPN